MNWQEPAALVLVAAAASLLIRMQVRSYRRRQARACGSDCNCAAPDDGAARTEEPKRQESIGM
jgi:hypothetical protein